MAYTAINNATIETDLGLVQGSYDETLGLYRYLGIPYAAAPVEELRFRPPVQHPGWDRVLMAERFDSAAPQLFDPTEGEYWEFSDSEPEEGQAWIGSEDCLTLNIWSPGNNPAKKPVVIWIHGGANWLESSRLNCYHGDKLAQSGDVVFVSLNYRLGVFGFLDVSVLGDDSYSGSHSTGLLDQLHALKWIQRNIANFGGDPANLTLMGESAGSVDISWLLAGGHLRGLVQRVVMMSGYAGLPGLSGDIKFGLTDEHAKTLARQYFADCGISSIEHLKSMSTGTLMEQLNEQAESSDMLFRMDSLFWPKTHASTSSLDPIAFAHDAPDIAIKVIIGFTNYEMGLWLNWDEELDTHDLDWMVSRLDIIPPALKTSAVALYREQFPDESEGQRAMHLLGDSVFVMPSLWAADGLSKHNNVWMYRFDKMTDDRRRAQHAADQVYLFDKLDTYVGKLLAGQTKDATERLKREQLSNVMKNLIFNFSRSGNPNPGGESFWPRYSADTRQLLALDCDSSVLPDPYEQRREWWYRNIYSPTQKKI